MRNEKNKIKVKENKNEIKSTVHNSNILNIQ